MKKSFTRVLCSAAATFLLTASVTGAEVPKKKIIDLAWGSPTVEFLAKNLEQMEKEAPVDGLMIRWVGEMTDASGKKVPVNLTHSMNAKLRMKREYFEKQIKLYKSLKFKKFTDNFLNTVVMPANQDWFNDQDWENICANYALAASIAKECGMKGIVFDPEEYAGKFWQYGTFDRSLEEGIAIARKRGQQWGRAIFTAYPTMKLFVLYWIAGAYDNMTEHFINGVYDVMPPTVTIYEGHETSGYLAKNFRDYDKILADNDRNFLKFLDPVHHQKHRAQTFAAPAFYLDSILGINKKWHKKFGVSIENPLVFLKRNLIYALDVSSEYVWFYSEKGCFWNGTKYPYWEKQFPGIVDVIRKAKEPLKEQISGKQNMLSPENLKVQWKYQQTPKAKGTATMKDGVFTITGCRDNGNHTILLPAKPNRTYLVRVEVLQSEEKNIGYPYLYAYLNHAGKGWTDIPRSQKRYLRPGAGKGWKTLELIIHSSDDTAYLAIELGALKQAPGEKVTFRNPQCKEL
ncbi:MAG: hypothetical protein IJW05_05410 [Lentisphaeria bacterium]|nr:hypothetical protein [Lentisphaeria bacterium]